MAKCFDYDRYQTSTAVPSMTQSDYARMFIPVPPLEEQERIAEWLDGKCGEIDELIEVEKQMIADLEAYRQAVITDAKTIPEEEMWKLEGLDGLILNALRHKPHFAHLSLEEALAIIKEVNPKEAYITHMCHHMGRHSEVNQTLPSNVHLAYDGLTLTVK